MENFSDENDELIIEIDFNDIIEKEMNGTLSNNDFTKQWCNLAALTIYRIEYIIRNSKHTSVGYTKDEAVIYGQLVRLFKLLCFQRRLVCTHLMTVTLASFFERMLIEQIINLEFYIKNYDNKQLLNNYRLNSLKPEVYFEKAIHDDISSHRTNSDFLAWQNRLLDSIHQTYKETGTSYEELQHLHIKIPNIHDKFCDTRNERLYDIEYRTKCHDIHGDWVDLLQNYLDYDESTSYFKPKFDDNQADIRQLNPILIICYNMIRAFLTDFPGHELPANLFTDINTDIKVIATLDNMHHNFINHKKILTGVDI